MRFYRAVLGWDYHWLHDDAGEGYALALLDDEPVAGSGLTTTPCGLDRPGHP